MKHTFAADAHRTAVTGRIAKTINRDWKFTYFPSGAEDLSPITDGYDDRDWLSVAVPHTWSTYETTGELHPFIRNPSEKDSTFWWYGWGWYRKTFLLDGRYRFKKVFIEFEGVQKYSKVWLNGQYIGDHKGGFTSFSFDVTEAVLFDRENVLSVEVSNRRNDPFGGIPPMTAGNWNTYGGIYRDVRIVIKDRLHIPFQGSAEHEGGTHITTPDLTAERGQVRVRTYVKNDYDAPVSCLLRTSVLDAEGKLTAAMQEEREIAPGYLLEYDQTSAEIDKPHLWSPETPYLYKVRSELILDGALVDHFDSPLGFRFFEWNYEEKRLYLNGKKIHIHGSNRHQEYPWLGDALPKWMHETDLQDIRFHLGFNFMRTCHYNQDPYVYDLCDKYGILVCEEVPNIKNIEFGVDIQKQHVIEMIRRDRNHPSIIMWSMGNETNHAADPRWAYAEDETRIIHCRHCAGMGEDLAHTHHQMPMESLLRCTIRGWYNADVKPLEPPNHQHTGHEEWQHDMSLSRGGERPLAVNGGKWIYADHGCDREYLNSPLKHVNPKGWVDAYRMPKYLYYLWAATWSEKPVIFIHPFDWTSRYLGQRRTITVNSNCDEVILRVNGVEIGRQKPEESNDYTVRFLDVLVQQGTITAEGMRNGEPASHEVAMAGPPARLTVTTPLTQIPADRSGIALMKIDIVDANGNHVYGAANELHFSVTGPGKLVGPDTYSSDIGKNGELDGTLYMDTPVAVPVRAVEKPGKIIFTVSSEGLEPAVIEIDAVPLADSGVDGIVEPPVPNGPPVLAARYEAEAAAAAKDLPAVTVPIQESVEDIDFRDMAEEIWRFEVDNWIRRRNPDIDTDTAAYDALLRRMTDQLIKDRGLTVADDYNFDIGHYNDCCRIVDHIQNSKWDARIKRKLEKHYVDSIITRGMEVDVRQELERLSGNKPWRCLGISPVDFGCCLPGGSFMPQAGSADPAATAETAGGAAHVLVKSIRGAYESGFDFVEWTVASLMQLSRGDFDDLKRVLRDNRLVIPVFNSFVPGDIRLTGPEVDWKAVETYVDQAMKRVHALGGRTIIFGSGKARSVPEGFSLQEGMDQIKRFLRICENYAAHYRITVAVEPLNRSESNIIRTVKEALTLAQELKLPHIAVLADSYHMFHEREPLTVLREAIEQGLLAHVHLAEADRSFPQAGSEGDRIDFAALLRELHESGFEGQISFECMSGYGQSAGSLAYIQSLWSN